MVKKDIVGDITVKKEDLFAEQECDKWLELKFGKNKKSAGQLHIRTHLRVKKNEDKIFSALNNKFGLLENIKAA